MLCFFFCLRNFVAPPDTLASARQQDLPSRRHESRPFGQLMLCLCCRMRLRPQRISGAVFSRSDTLAHNPSRKQQTTTTRTATAATTTSLHQKQTTTSFQSLLWPKKKEFLWFRLRQQLKKGCSLHSCRQQQSRKRLVFWMLFWWYRSVVARRDRLRL